MHESVFDRKGIPRFMVIEWLVVGIHRGLQLRDRQVTIGDEETANLVKIIIRDFMPEDQLKRVVDRTLCKIGRSLFLWHLADPKENKVDRPGGPSLALGHAMRRGFISPDEVRKIRFGADETTERFAARAEGLLEDVVNQLRDGTAFERPIDLRSGIRMCY